MDRDTGEPLMRSENYVPHQNAFAKPSREGTLVAPSAYGGNQWSPMAYSAQHELIYVQGIHSPMRYVVRSEPRVPGQMWVGGTLHLELFGDSIPRGIVSAIEVGTGGIRWQRTVQTPTVGGLLVTRGNLVFVGHGDGWFEALHASTGEPLWRFQLAAGVHGGPITFSHLGKQYVIVAAGGNTLHRTKTGGAVVSFALEATDHSAIPGAGHAGYKVLPPIAESRKGHRLMMPLTWSGAPRRAL